MLKMLVTTPEPSATNARDSTSEIMAKKEEWLVRDS